MTLWLKILILKLQEDPEVRWVLEDRWGLVQAVTWEATTDLWVSYCVFFTILYNLSS